ncbi:MAG: class I SAM-dependent methyltransferase [Candidatus Omnitrophica bacterium]|nr:class I SAM-dependent methyltransferase [Candidatus Omnitrophota bacterium]MCB9748076.1 class I SAM-dependent methyltransferase [Candidatus Omnitrophota bacterium]
MKKFLNLSQKLLEKGLIPDPLIRMGIRGLLREKLEEEKKVLNKLGEKRKYDLIEQLKNSPIAVNTQDANQQHYELPTEFFQLIMGSNMKYSCGYWKDGVNDFNQSEADMLQLTLERSEIQNGQSILELGCGWGSLTLFMAEHFPENKIVAVSNSRTQKQFIDSQACQRGLKNIRVITADMNTFFIDEKFDRIVSVEMFEHMRNYSQLLKKLSEFIKEDGKLFIHIFTHREFAYLYDEKDESDWIAKYFFTGGIMPSDDLLLSFQDDFEIEEQWQVNGKHYQRTSEAWLSNMDKNKNKIIPILTKTYGENQCKKWWMYWRVFFMSCAELWGYKNGTEWIVSHYRFRKRIS